MTNRTEIEISGLGGQGVITLSKLIASAVILHEKGKNATQTEAYGAAARGWTCWGEVVIHDSEEIIDYPRAIPPYDILIVLSEAAAVKYKKSSKPGGIVIYDSTTVRPKKVKFRKSIVYDVPAQKLAREEFGQTVVANVLLFGAIVGITNIISEESGLKTVTDFVPKKFQDLNIAAYKKGVELGKKLKAEKEAAAK
ncbi:MAG: 2-oxoacid:acceptor oxidoreductase family protein [Candidatus Helarchaeota archaeon]